MKRFLRTKRAGALFALLVMAATVALFAGRATAVHNTGLFELDGNAIDQPAAGDDWSTVFAGSGGGFFSKSFIGADKEAPANDTTFFTSGGSKDVNDISQWAWSANDVAPDKNQITDAYAAAYVGSGNLAGHTLLYFGQDRFDTSGDSNVGFWFVQDPNFGLKADGTFSGQHQNGDIFVVSAFTNGGAQPNIDVYEWQNGGLSLIASGGGCTSAPFDDAACAVASPSGSIVAPGPYLDKAGNTTIQPNGFFEGGVDLNSIFKSSDLPCFSNFLAETRSSQSPSAQLKDFAIGGVSSCGTVTIHKDATPNDAQDFSYSSTGGLTPSTFSLDDDGDATLSDTQTFTSVKPGAYSVTEGAQSNPWQFDHVSCTSSGSGTSATANGQTVNITLGLAGNVDCTYFNNKKPSLTVNKVLAPANDAGKFNLQIDGSTAGTGANVGNGGTTGAVLVSTGSHTVGEAAGTATSLADFTSSTSCSINGGAGSATSTVNLAAGDSAVCTITNTRTPKLTVIKHVINNANGTKVAGDFNINVAGTSNPNPSSFQGAESPGTKVAVGVGSYNVTEPSHAGYTVSLSADCTGTLAAGDDKTCTVTNDDVNATPSLTTLLSADSVTVGSSVQDSATLHNATANAGGTVTYTVYTNNACSLGARDAGTKTVTNGSVLNSNSLAFDTAGDFYWQALYSGDTNNEAAKSVCTEEHLVVNPAKPAISTTASATVTVGGKVSDTAHLSGGFNPTGSVTFNLYGPNDTDCSKAAAFTDTKTVNGNGDYVSAEFTTAAAGTYRWVASYSGDGNNDPVAGKCNDATESVVVSPAKPAITTTASATVTVGGKVSDTAHLAGGVSPTGTVTFNLYGPNDATCAGAAIFTDTKPVNGNGDYVSAEFTTLKAGTYRWVASYSGDGNNDAAAGKCNDTNESVVVSPAKPAISTTASATVTVGGKVSDTAHLSGGFNPTGTVTFKLYGPDDANCSKVAVLTTTKPVNGNGDYVSAEFTTLKAGTYRWVASYSGDSNNDDVSGACNDATESVVVAPASPEITTTASANVAVGGVLTDVAHLSGGFEPTGTVTFKLYGPNDADCSKTAVFTSTVGVAGNGDYLSAGFTANNAGTYRWVASYSGDDNNNATAGKCNDVNESAVVAPAAPAISTTASATVTVGGKVSDTAHLSGGSSPTGTVTFKLYGPNDADCSKTAVFTDTKPVSGNGNYVSAEFTTTAAGTYRW